MARDFIFRIKRGEALPPIDPSGSRILFNEEKQNLEILSNKGVVSEFISGESSSSSGTSGANGSSGTSGANGSSGTSGANGSSGTSGANGSSGTSGANGSSGSSGASGSSGSSGANGSSGSSGANGSSGTSGLSPTTGSWILSPGANTVSFTVTAGQSYVMWVNGNIPNGIVNWNATVTLSNTNVPAIGVQYGWYYVDGNALVLTSIPSHIVGVAGSIGTASTPGLTNSNTFTFGITNNSVSSQIIYYGYTQVS